VVSFVHSGNKRRGDFIGHKPVGFGPSNASAVSTRY
jgi:hypothetical protein